MTGVSKQFEDWGINSLSNTNERKTLLRHWSQRYFMTLLIGLLIIATVSVLWIRQTTIENRLNLTHLVAQEIADRIVNTNGRILAGPLFQNILEERSQILNFPTAPTAVVVGENGKTLTSNQRPDRGIQLGEQVPASIYEDRQSTMKLENGKEVYIVSEPIQSSEDVIGYVVLVQYKSILAKSNQEYSLLFILLGSLGLLGWLVVYFLTKQLSKPIKETVMAAQQVSEGNYEVSISHPKEQELAELTETFQEMSYRLKNLEKVRTELLAGVTHDLKTPVTSISGLIQAVKQEIVTGEEAKEFLDLSLKESDRLKVMIQDLLTFNTFASGALPVHKKNQPLIAILKEVEKQWKSIEPYPRLFLDLPSKDIRIDVDEHRLKQILMNLLTNAKQAMEGSDRTITIRLLLPSTSEVLIEVEDEGKGIPEKDRPYVFERFFRGTNKKLKVRGLGLGLPLSFLLAQAHQGDLTLSRTSEKGTTFTLRLPVLEIKKPDERF